jgi:hypothetical protein
VRFKTYLNGFPEVGPCLPLVHITSSNHFRTILATGEVKAVKECPVFKELLVYLFYGRPAFKVEVDNPEQRVVDEYLPTALILEPSVVSRIERIYPFDSGAFAGANYRGAHHKEAALADYELEPVIASAQKVVGAFFETNAKYFLGECVETCAANAFDHPEVHAHFALISGATGVQVDDRRYSVEIQTKEKLKLDPGLLAIVVPHSWLNSETVQNFLKVHPKVTPLSYSRYVGLSVAHSHGAIFERVRDYFVQEGLV